MEEKDRSKTASRRQPFSMVNMPEWTAAGVMVR